jgi:hypothetical protein
MYVVVCVPCMQVCDDRGTHGATARLHTCDSRCHALINDVFVHRVASLTPRTHRSCYAGEGEQRLSSWEVFERRCARNGVVQLVLGGGRHRSAETAQTSGTSPQAASSSCCRGPGTHNTREQCGTELWGIILVCKVLVPFRLLGLGQRFNSSHI